MASFGNIIRQRLHEEPIDAWLSKWGGVIGGFLIIVLSAATFLSHARSWIEFLLGIGLASIGCSSLVLFGVLARRVHLAWHRGVASWRLRLGEFLGLGAGVATIGGGLWFLTSLQLDLKGMVMGGLVFLSLAFMIISLGLWSTLTATAERSTAADPTRRSGL